MIDRISRPGTPRVAPSKPIVKESESRQRDPQQRKRPTRPVDDNNHHNNDDNQPPHIDEYA